jgi:CheY-like chemotaxis protein
MGVRILLVEDDAEIRRVLRRALKGEGYEVHEAANGDEALQAFQTEPFDLVVTDILMPERDGLETIVSIRREVPSIKIIAISGAPNQELFLDNASGLGATRVLAKPFTPRQLNALVKEMLSSPTAT